MRIFAYILLLLILFLTFSPCRDNDSCCNDTACETSDKQQEEQSSCTPFCVGSDCSNIGFIVEVSSFSINLFEEDNTLLVGEYRSIFISNYFHTIWQPPKLNA